jgi:hypothetical protein
MGIGLHTWVITTGIADEHSSRSEDAFEDGCAQ